MKTAIIGSGTVGQATGIGFSKMGNQVTFYDIDKEKLARLRSKGYETNDNLEAAISGSEIIFVCVPTPSVHDKIDFSYIKEASKNIAKVLKRIKQYSVVTYRSTIPPQTTRTKLIPIIERFSGLTSGRHFGVCMNPEFLREKSALEDFLKPNRVVVGALDEKSSSVLKKIYSKFRCPFISTSLDTAEMIKYASNTFLAAKISFFNEMFLLCQKLKINPRVVADAVSLDPRIGTYGVQGGKPFGGFCLPKDLAAFINYCTLNGFNPKMLKTAAKVNKEIGTHRIADTEAKLEVIEPCSSWVQ